MDGERDPSRDRGAEPHDILAAEAFAMGEGDPGLHREAAHDILAAEAFALPSADRGSRHTPPDEHTDDPAPHDVLSAEEYAMPAATPHALPPDGGRWRGPRRSWAPLVGWAAALMLVRALARRRRARRRAP
ncbi:MAG TPA: hypothetical protein VFP55_08075 [Solirubrobacteraceae bacterium]|nr:hypothetical protein [Solirubrobacteraceae bacterium]